MSPIHVRSIPKSHSDSWIAYHQPRYGSDELKIAFGGTKAEAIGNLILEFEIEDVIDEDEKKMKQNLIAPATL